jgi:hypothetical protein
MDTTQITWPSSRNAARLEDMSPNGHLQVSLDESGDAIVEVFNGECFTSVEFCSGAGGGGKPRRLLKASVESAEKPKEDNYVGLDF